MWYSAAHDLAVCARQLALTLWTPQVKKWGIPFSTITEHTAALNKWRDDHLSIVGANNDLQNIGDYVAAVSACKSPFFLLFPLGTASVEVMRNN